MIVPLASHQVVVQIKYVSIVRVKNQVFLQLLVPEKTYRLVSTLSHYNFQLCQGGDSVGTMSDDLLNHSLLRLRLSLIDFPNSNYQVKE